MTNQTLNQNQEIGVLEMTNHNQETPTMTQEQAFDHLLDVEKLGRFLQQMTDFLKEVILSHKKDSQKLVIVLNALINLETELNKELAGLFDNIKPFCDQETFGKYINSVEFYKNR